MSRRQLTCPCGWVFFVTDVGPKGVDCPNCGKQILVGRPALRKKNATTVAAEHQDRDRQSKVVLWAGIGAVFVVGAVIGIVIFARPKPKNDPPIRILEETRTTTWNSRQPVEDLKPTTGAAADYARAIDHACWTADVAGVIAELMRLRGAPEKARELDLRMADYERDIDTCLDKLREKNESRPVPEHLQPGDKILFFRGMDFSKAPAVERDKQLAKAIRSLKTYEMWDITIQRSDDVIGFMAYFKEKPKPLIAMIEQYRTAIGNLPPPAELAAVDPPPPEPVKLPQPNQPQPSQPPPIEPTPPPAQPTALPTDVLAAVKEKWLKLPAYYQGFLTAEERARLDFLAKEGKGLPDDVDFIRTRVLTEAFSEVSDDRDFIMAQVIELKEKATQVVATVDVVIKKDGTRLEGKITEDNDDVLKLEINRNGVRGTITIQRSDVLSIEKSGGPGAEFNAKIAAAKGKVAALASLAAWCKDKKLEVQMTWTAYQILELDPANDAARLAAGYVKAGLVWTKEREVKRKGDEIVYAGKSYTMTAFVAMLKVRGYVEMNGQWSASARGATRSPISTGMRTSSSRASRTRRSSIVSSARRSRSTTRGRSPTRTPIGTRTWAG